MGLRFRKSRSPPWVLGERWSFLNCWFLAAAAWPRRGTGTPAAAASVFRDDGGAGPTALVGARDQAHAAFRSKMAHLRCTSRF